MKQIIVETIIRLTSKSPKYFKVLQILISVITAACAFLTYAQDHQLFTLPAWSQPFTGANSIIMGIITLIIARLPATSSADQVKARVEDRLSK